MTPSLTSRRPTLVDLLVAIGGLVLFIYFIRRAGIDDVAQGISGLGRSFLLVVTLGGLRFLLRAAAWMRCFEGDHRLKLNEVFRAVIAGDALGNLTPLGLVVSEPTKAMFLRHRQPLEPTLVALAVENLFYTLSAILVIAGGFVTLFLVFQAPGQLWIASTILVTALAALVISAHWIIWNRVPVGSTTLNWLRQHRVSPTLTDYAASRVYRIEDRVYSLYPREWSRLLLVAALESTFHILAVLEIFLVLPLISGQQPTVLDAFVLESTNRFIAVVFKFVPMRLGVDEAGTAIFADLLGFGTATGVTLAIIRKARMLVWIALGVAVLVWRGLSVGRLLAPTSSHVALVIMARSPVAGTVPKTRLADVVTDASDRRHLYASFLKDTIDACRPIDTATLRVAYTLDGGTAGFPELGITVDELLPQRGADLGAREYQVFTDLISAGFEKVVMIGSDLPTLPTNYIQQAIDKVSTGTVVLGPSEDGGYYLIALAASRPDARVPDLFTDVRWSTSSTLEDTCAVAHRSGLQVELLPRWYDVDDADGLRRLRAELADETGQTRAPETARILKDIGA